MIQSPYGDPVEPEKAPEAISKAVASLPPEQMFELMKQMKVWTSCVNIWLWLFMRNVVLVYTINETKQLQ